MLLQSHVLSRPGWIDHALWPWRLSWLYKFLRTSLLEQTLRHSWYLLSIVTYIKRLPVLSFGFALTILANLLPFKANAHLQFCLLLELVLLLLELDILWIVVFNKCRRLNVSFYHIRLRNEPFLSNCELLGSRRLSTFLPQVFFSRFWFLAGQLIFNKRLHIVFCQIGVWDRVLAFWFV